MYQKVVNGNFGIGESGQIFFYRVLEFEQILLFHLLDGYCCEDLTYRPGIEEGVFIERYLFFPVGKTQAVFVDDLSVLGYQYVAIELPVFMHGGEQAVQQLRFFTVLVVVAACDQAGAKNNCQDWYL